MHIVTAIEKQSEISKETFRCTLIALKSVDLNIHDLKTASSEVLYTKSKGKEFLSQKIALWKKKENLLIKLYNKNNPNISSQLNFILKLIKSYLLLLKGVKKSLRTNELQKPINEGFILTNIGKLMLGLASALLEMDHKLIHTPNAVGHYLDPEPANWGTLYGLRYLIRKTMEHGRFNCDETSFIEDTLNVFFSEWLYE